MGFNPRQILNMLNLNLLTAIKITKIELRMSIWSFRALCGSAYHKKACISQAIVN